MARNPSKVGDVWVATHSDGSKTEHKTRDEAREKIKLMKNSNEVPDLEDIPEEPEPAPVDETWEDALVRLLSRASYELSKEIKACSENLTAIQVELMSQLNPDGVVNQRELVSSMNCSLGNVSHAMGRLETMGFVKRTRSESDRREIDITLTAKGKKLRESVVTKRDETLASFFKPLTLKDMKSTCQSLEKLIK